MAAGVHLPRLLGKPAEVDRLSRPSDTAANRDPDWHRQSIARYLRCCFLCQQAGFGRVPWRFVFDPRQAGNRSRVSAATCPSSEGLHCFVRRFDTPSLWFRRPTEQVGWQRAPWGYAPFRQAGLERVPCKQSARCQPGPVLQQAGCRRLVSQCVGTLRRTAKRKPIPVASISPFERMVALSPTGRVPQQCWVLRPMARVGPTFWQARKPRRFPVA